MSWLFLPLLRSSGAKARSPRGAPRFEAYERSVAMVRAETGSRAPRSAELQLVLAQSS